MNFSKEMIARFLITCFSMFDMISMLSNKKVIGVRFASEDVDILRTVCKARGEDVSDFVRRAVRRELAHLSFYTEMEKKALGLTRSKNGIERGNLK